VTVVSGFDQDKTTEDVTVPATEALHRSYRSTESHTRKVA
jgi:hypothetical protein